MIMAPRLAAVAQTVQTSQHVHVGAAQALGVTAFLGGHDVGRRLVPGIHVGQAGLGPASRALGRHLRIHHHARVEAVEVGAEQIIAFLEEGPPLGVAPEDGAVHVDLGGVGLDLAEVGIDGGLGRHIRSDGVLEAHRGRAQNVVILQARLRVPGVTDGAELAARQRGQNFQPLARRHAAHSRHPAPLAGAAAVVPVPGRPAVLVVAFPGAAAHQVQAPGLRLGCGKAHARKGDGHLNHVAVLADPGGRVPDHVEAPVLAVHAGPHQILLDAVGIHEQPVGPLGLAEGVQVNAHRVVVEELVTLAQGGPQGGGVVLADEGHVQVAVVVGQLGAGAHLGAGVVAGVGFRKPRDHRGSGPHPLVQDAVDLHRAFGAQGLHFRLDQGGEGIVRRPGRGGIQAGQGTKNQGEGSHETHGQDPPGKVGSLHLGGSPQKNRETVLGCPGPGPCLQEIRAPSPGTQTDVRAPGSNVRSIFLPRFSLLRDHI